MTSSSQPVGPTLGEGLIADTAERARQLLLCCREITDEEPRKLALTQLSRFNLWASNIGVFAARHASLDYRLRTAPSVRVAVEGNLDMVCKRLLTSKPNVSREYLSANISTQLSRRLRNCLRRNSMPFSTPLDLTSQSLQKTCC